MIAPSSRQRRRALSPETPMDAAFASNCPIVERTADGVSVGRCWAFCKDGICPRHGDVSEYLKRLPTLTDENELRAMKRTQSLPH